MNNFNKKLLINNFWVLTKELEVSGILSFSLTLNFPDNCEKHQVTELNDKVNLFVDDLKNSIELLAYIIIVAELNENENWHLHGTIGIKSIIGYNPVIKENLYQKLLWWGYGDINLKILKKDKDVYNWLVYSIKDVRPWSIDWRLWFLTAIDIKPLFEPIFICLKELIKNMYPFVLVCWSSLPESHYDFMLGSKDVGENPENACLNIWYYYMYLNNIRVYKKRLYKRVEGTYISYELFGEMDILDDNFTDIMVSFLNRFPLQFRNLDVVNLKREGLVKLSFRSSGDFSVNSFARKYFSGGGHKNAAGGKSELSLKETEKKFLEILNQYKQELNN